MEPARAPAPPRRRAGRRRPFVLAAMLAVLAPMLSVSPGAATEAVITVDVTVVDGHGHPFPPSTAGVLACPTIGWSVPCTALVVGVDHDGDGHVTMGVDGDVSYRVAGFVRDAGWPDPHFVAPDGTEFHFSPGVETTGAALDGRTFVVERPKAKERREPGTTTVSVTVLDGTGHPFPAGMAGAMACTSAACDPMIVGAADVDGVARLTLATKTEYTVTALVRNPGWPCGGWVSPTGDVFFFSDPVVRTGIGFHRPTTLTIVEPPCS